MRQSNSGGRWAKTSPKGRRLAVRRPLAHAIGDEATSQVAALFASFGWAVDRVQSDYGEDLIVQLTKEEVVQGWRLFVQVKARVEARKPLEPGCGSPPISVALINKWTNTSDVVMVVLWDTMRRQGVYSIVNKQLTANVRMRIAEQNTYRFKLDSLLDSVAASRVQAQYCYIRYLQGLVSFLAVLWTPSSARFKHKPLQRVMDKYVYPFLESVDVTQDNEVTENIVVAVFVRLMKDQQAKKRIPQTDKARLMMAIRIAIDIIRRPVTERMQWHASNSELRVAASVVACEWVLPGLVSIQKGGVPLLPNGALLEIEPELFEGVGRRGRTRPRRHS